jgi:hypothetical protein
MELSIDLGTAERIALASRLLLGVDGKAPPVPPKRRERHKRNG